MLRVALTGGIGSGKSTVCDAFKKLGIPVLSADKFAAELTQQPEIIAQIAQAFGEELITEGQLDRRAMRQRIFADPQQRRQLEALLHPKIIEKIQSALQNESAPYAIIEIPLLVETGFNAGIDRVLVVDCEVEDQIQRTMARDQSSREDVEKIIAQQVTRGERLAHADNVIVNTGDIDALDAHVLELDQIYRAL